MSQSQSSEWQRNDKKSKNFECPCGKAYLSYPALYTHIKQAHGGKAPGEIKRPDAHNRGRPKTSGNSKIEEHNKFIEDGLKNDPIPDLIELLQTAKVSKNRQIKQIYENQPVFKLIMNDKDRPFTPQYLKEDRVFDVKMGEGIIQFFQEIQQKIENKNVYDEIVMLIVLLTQHIIEETEDQNVLTLGTIGLMPEFVNYFIIHDFKKPVERLKLQKLWVFQDQNSIKIFNLFFRWMLFKKFTLTKVEINEKYLNPNQSDSENERGNEEKNDSDEDDEDDEADDENDREESQSKLQDNQSDEEDDGQSDEDDKNQQESSQINAIHCDEEESGQTPNKKVKGYA